MPALKYTDEGILAVCEKVLAEHGDVTLHEFWNITGICPAHLQRRFGGWLAVKRRLGWTARRKRPTGGRVHSRESIVAALKEAAAELGDDLTLAEFTRRTGITEKPIAAYCGNWGRLRVLAGLVANNRGRKRIPDEALFADLWRLRQQFNRYPMYGEYERYGLAHVSTVVRRFGGMAGAMDACDAFYRKLVRDFPVDADRNREFIRLGQLILRPVRKPVLPGS
jgi:hypothetical protein